MLTVKLQGGLGNQLFQYATGRALADKLNIPLYLDLYYLAGSVLHTKNETPRAYALFPYNINAQLLQPQEYFWQTYIPTRLKKLIFTTLHYQGYKTRLGEDFSPEEVSILINKPQSILLEGFFQHEKYFIAIRQKLLEQICPTIPLPPEYQSYADKITSSNSVAVHIRRGDYVTNPGANAFHGKLPEKYYQDAISLYREKEKDTMLFFFSDDMDWVKSRFGNYENVIFTETKNPYPHLDLELMRRCRHQVIANSSFSWWGAWLNDNPKKIVIAPEKWFTNQNDNRNFTLPPAWIRI
jgi:hypothetical protein